MQSATTTQGYIPKITRQFNRDLFVVWQLLAQPKLYELGSVTNLWPLQPNISLRPTELEIGARFWLVSAIERECGTFIAEIIGDANRQHQTNVCCAEDE